MKLFLVTLLASTLSYAATLLPHSKTSNPINFLLGRWEGLGIKGTTKRISSECNYSKMNGQIAVIEARYLEVESQKLYLEFGILSPLENSGKYRFSMYRNDGTTLEAEAQLDGERQLGLLEFDLPPQSANGPTTSIRYTIQVTGNNWLEVGELSVDKGLNWKKFYEMNLKKIADTCQEM
jgi:hypothetical protein